MLYLSLRGMETIIQKRDTLTNAIKQLALWSSLKEQPQPFFEEYEIFHPGLWLCQNRTQLETESYAEVKRTTRFDFSRATYTL